MQYLLFSDKEKWAEGSQKVQASDYKINKSWGCDVQHGNYS